MPTTPRSDQRIAFSTMISFRRRSKVRSIIRISPARTCGYSRLARSSPADRGEDDVVEVALAAAVSLHRVEAQLERRDPLRAVRAADRAVHRALDRERRGLDQLRPVVDLVELVEALHAVRVGHGDERVELPEVLHRQCDALFVRDRPEDVGGDRAAEMRVELGEPFLREDHRASLFRRRLREGGVERRGELDRPADEEEAEEETGGDTEHAVRLLALRQPRKEDQRVE